MKRQNSFFLSLRLFIYFYTLTLVTNAYTLRFHH